MSLVMADIETRNALMRVELTWLFRDKKGHDHFCMGSAGQ
jgi:hypothetical protein